LAVSQNSTIRCSVVSIVCCLLALGSEVPQSTAVQAASRCSVTLRDAAPWNATCYRSQVPVQLLQSAPFTVRDPRQLVSSLTGLALSGIYVAQLGSDYEEPQHPLGPLMMVDYLFGSVPIHGAKGHSKGPYVRVWEEGYPTSGDAGLSSSSQDVWNDGVTFSRERMEVQVGTNGPRRWATTLAHRISQAIRAHRVKPLPPLRLYVHGPRTHLAVGQPITFFILNNGRASHKAAAFDLIVHGGWGHPKALSPDQRGACGGDNEPALSSPTRTAWHLNFGDCDEVRIVITPTRPGMHSLIIRTYQVAAGPNGMVKPSRRHLVRDGGYTWTGAAS
jgi:hypothetical protein